MLLVLYDFDFRAPQVSTKIASQFIYQIMDQAFNKFLNQCLVKCFFQMLKIAAILGQIRIYCYGRACSPIFNDEVLYNSSK